VYTFRQRKQFLNVELPSVTVINSAAKFQLQFDANSST